MWWISKLVPARTTDRICHFGQSTTSPSYAVRIPFTQWWMGVTWTKPVQFTGEFNEGED